METIKLEFGSEHKSLRRSESKPSGGYCADLLRSFDKRSVFRTVPGWKMHAPYRQKLLLSIEVLGLTWKHGDPHRMVRRRCLADFEIALERFLNYTALPCNILTGIFHEGAEGLFILIQEVRCPGCLTVGNSAVEHLRRGVTHRATISPIHLTWVHRGGVGKQSDQIVDFPGKLGQQLTVRHRRFSWRLLRLLGFNPGRDLFGELGERGFLIVSRVWWKFSGGVLRAV